jgi:predicted Zn-ribbon and HTH transcriptional regulator
MANAFQDITAVDIIEMIRERYEERSEGSPSVEESPEWIAGGIKETCREAERENLALGIMHVVKHEKTRDYLRERALEVAKRINPNEMPPQCCVTCEEIFQQYDVNGRCPRCGSQDCGTISALFPEADL